MTQLSTKMKMKMDRSVLQERIIFKDAGVDFLL